MIFKNLLTPVFILLTIAASGQRNIKTQAERAPLISFTYGFYTPAADMADRFGENSTLGLAFHYKTKKNIVFGAESSFLFGRNVIEPDMLKSIQSSYGEVFDRQSQVAEILLFERGYALTFNAGKVFPLKTLNPNSGIFIKGGIGFLQHKIRVEHQLHRIPQLEGDYEKGYDRLTNGLVLNQFIGLLNMSNSRLANFYVGLDIFEGFTRGRRDFNFDTRQPYHDKRMDIMIGFKLGWCLPIYKRMSDDYYIN